MIPNEVTRLFRENMHGIDGVPIFRGILGDRRIYAFKLSRPMNLGHPIKVVEEKGTFRIAGWDEMIEIENAIAKGMLNISN